MRAWILLLLAAMLSCDVSGSKIVLFANITGNGQNGKVDAQCVSDDFSDAIAWITPAKEEFIHPTIVNESLKEIQLNLKHAGWGVESSYKGLFGPVMDYTWEMFQIIMTKGAKLETKYNFHKLGIIRIYNQFEFNFSFLGKSNAQIYMCNHEKVNGGNCFIFILGGWNGYSSIVRKCKEYASLINSKDSIDGCPDMIPKVNHTTLLFSEDRWGHISLKYESSNLTVLIDGKPILSYTSTDENEFNNYTHPYIAAHTPTSNFIDSDWFYITSKTLCVSFLANSEEDITVKLISKQNDIINNKTYEKDANSNWNFKTFKAAVIETGLYILRIEYNNEKLLTIRNLVIHNQCDLSKTHSSHISTLKYNGKDASKIQCSSLRGDDKPISARISRSSDSNSIPSMIQNCAALYNFENCFYRMYCNAEYCYCFEGFTGEYCQNECNWGYFGYNCVNKCGNCKNGGTCDKSSGNCFSGCKDNYIEAQCIEKKLPVLINIASIQTECITECKVTLYANDLQYEGKQVPTYYYTRLIDKYKTTRESDFEPITTSSILFDNLNKDSKYEYQVVLCVDNNKSSCYSNDIKTFQFQTKCEELRDNQIQIESIDRTTTFNVVAFNTKNQCDLNRYYITIYDEFSKKVNRYNDYLRKSNVEENDLLQIFTNYTLQLTRNNIVTHNIRFQTDESVPNRVNNIIISSPSPDSLFIEWEEPTPALGIIIQYQIECKYIGKRDCHASDTDNSVFSINITTTEIKINNLQPYSTYEISVYAYTRKGQGAVSKNKGYTKPLDMFSLKSFHHTVSSKEQSQDVIFNVSCSDWNGPVNVYAKATCKSEWCDGDTQNVTKKIAYNDMIATIEKLLPYTNYTLDVYLHSKKKEIEKESNKLTTADVMTLPSVPNKISFAEVYSITDTSLSVRWTAPYPPTGMLDHFYVEVQYKNYHNKWKSYSTPKVMNTNNTCTIWTNMFCTTISNLYKNYEHVLFISGKNTNTSYGQTFTLYEKTTIKEPKPPLNIQGTWNSNILILNWQHPNKTNGPFKYFTVRVNSGNPIDHFVSTENLIYTFNTSHECTTENHKATVSLQTHNSLYPSQEVYNSFTCPVFQPSFLSEPELRSIKNNTLTVFIPSLQNIEKESHLYIIIFTNQQNLEDNCSQSINETILSSLNTSDHKCSIIKQYAQITYSEIVKSVHDLHLKSFNFKKEFYKLGILLINKFDGETKHNWFELKNMTDKSKDEATPAKSNYWWLALLSVLVVIFMTIVYLWYKRPACIYKFVLSSRNRMGTHENQNESMPLTAPRQQVLPTTITTPLSERPLVPVKPQSRYIISISSLGEYVKQATLDGDLERQHEKFPRGLHKPHDTGKLPNNFPKNRYKNLIAYDHTRVKLKCHNGKPTSDYINANYIKSPLCDKAFIATQGPLESTVYDFWHMILTEGVEHIVMLANLIETGKQKVSPYWPDFKKMNKTMNLDDIKIIATSEKSSYNFVTRTFKVIRNEIAMKVTQLHFTSWPDHGVPLYPQSLIPFIERIFVIPHSSEHPILVHCSAGVGRTGTIILIDNCLRQANLTKSVNPFHEFGLLREQRSNLVDNPEQYKLVHLVLLEYFSPLKTTHLSEEFGVVYKELNDAQIERMLNYITDSEWQESAFQAPLSALQTDPTKNRDNNIVPNAYGILYLRPRAEGDSRYINAVCVDGFNKPQKFISTQHPLENTIDDFWRLVIDQEVKVVINLQAECDIPFWIHENDFTSTGGTLVEHMQFVVNIDYTVHTVDVQLKGQLKTTVKLIECKNWNIGQLLPENLDVLISIWKEVMKLQLQDSSILVMCRNGASACGLYIAMTNLLDRMQDEQVVDVCMAVRAIRRSRKQFVNNIDQLRALYRLVALHLSEFAIYSNFTPMTDGTDQE